MSDMLRTQSAATFGVVERYVMPESLAEALTRLAAYCDQVAVLGIYQHLFPLEFETSTASLYTERGKGYSPREVEFFHLTHAYCFPFPVAHFMQLSERQETFEIPFLGIDQENLPNLAVLQGGWQLLYFFALLDMYGYGEEEIDGWLNEMEYGVKLLPILREAAQQGVYQRDFLAECRVGPEPLCYLPEAFEICSQETGNVYYLFDHEEYEDYETRAEEEGGMFVPRFTVEVFQYLTKQWQAAQTIEAHCDALMAWMDDDPERYEEVATLWAKHMIKPA